MALLFLGAAKYQITARDLDIMKRDFDRLNVETSKQVLKVYQSRRETAADSSSLRRLPELHANLGRVPRANH
jgi:ribosomal protein RSM22 (predicted rRNA methylase)